MIATPGSESNVKEIFDKCWELKKTRTDIQIFNQFEEFGNPLWHYMVTGKAAEEVLKKEMGAITDTRLKDENRSKHCRVKRPSNVRAPKRCRPLNQK